MGLERDALLLSLVCTLIFSVVHIFVSKLEVPKGKPRSWWLSAAAGIAVGYVFIQLLPELAEGQATFEDVFSAWLGELTRHLIYLIALVGLILFFGLERLALKPSRVLDTQDPDALNPRVFWIHLGYFMVYTVLIGYLVHRDNLTHLETLWYAIAMALHFVVTDLGLRGLHPSYFDRFGRWLMAGAALLGWAVGLFIDVSPPWIAALTAFMTGAIVLNVLKEELPGQHQSRFWAFALGGFGYTVLYMLAT